MLIALTDWQLDVDIERTMELSVSQGKEHCTCGYCRNFYATLDQQYPTIRPFLARFGLEAEAPDELCPYEPTIYEATYVVQGSILHVGAQRLCIDNIPLRISSSEQSDIYTEHPKPYFTVSIGLMELPWSLDEPMDQVISPANEAEFLNRMQTKLLRHLSADAISS